MAARTPLQLLCRTTQQHEVDTSTLSRMAFGDELEALVFPAGIFIRENQTVPTRRRDDDDDDNGDR